MSGNNSRKEESMKYELSSIQNRARVAMLFFALTFFANAASAEVMIGERVQDLGKDVTWIKGDPVPEFKRGQVYVLDLWGTWCPPCLADIPHLNAIANKYRNRGVSIIGLSIPFPGTIPTAEFVAKKGDKMSYIIAEDINRKISDRFKDVLGNNTYPTLAIIDKEGRLAWMGQGYPIRGFEEALEKTVMGTYNIEAAAKEHLHKREIKLKASPLLKQLGEMWKAKNCKEALQIVRQLVELDSAMFGEEVFSAYLHMMGKATKVEALDFAQEAVDKLLVKNDPDLAWTLGNISLALTHSPADKEFKEFVVRANLESRELDIAMKAAERASEITQGKDPWRLQSLAMVWFARGDYKQAASLMTKSVETAERLHWGEDELEKLQAMLKKYKQKADRKGMN